MSALFTLASDFIERMSNPGFGAATNDEYTMRFAMVLPSEQLESEIRKGAETLKDVCALTPHGWFWLLNLARSRNVKLNDRLLVDIIDRWSNVSLTVLALDLATRYEHWKLRNRPLQLEQFDSHFVRDLLQRVTSASGQAINEKHVEKTRTDRAETVLVAFLQVGNELCVDAASALLAHNWQGAPKLREFYRHLHEGLDSETQKAWDALIRWK